MSERAFRLGVNWETAMMIFVPGLALFFYGLKLLINDEQGAWPMIAITVPYLSLAAWVWIYLMMTIGARTDSDQSKRKTKQHND